MNFSYWEDKTWLSNTDFTIVGSGITGLNCALRLREKFPKAKILILERGVLPNGASTKNAGFACFGSISELAEDVQNHSEEEVVELVKNRSSGLELLRKNLGDRSIDFQKLGGYELFVKEDQELYQTCLEKINYFNQLLFPLFKEKIFEPVANNFGFKKIQPQLIFNRLEGQIDTGKMMEALLLKAQKAHIKILPHTSVTSYEETAKGVEIFTSHFHFTTNKLFIATNGFAKDFSIPKVKPARAQVLITQPIENLKIKGTFHLERGYYYFRNIDNRILLGGGRNLDFKAEETTVLAQTEKIQQKLEQLLSETILPETKVKIDKRWSGIMGVGSQKKPIVKQLSSHIFCGVRLGGMGIAIGSWVGRELADLT